MTINRSVFCLIFILLSALPALSVPSDEDLGWARSVLDEFASKGLMRAEASLPGLSPTRWEVALQVAELVEQVQAQNAFFVTRGDLDNIRILVDRFETELSQFGVGLRVPVQPSLDLSTQPLDFDQVRLDFDSRLNVSIQGLDSGWGNSFQRFSVDWRIDPALTLQGGLDREQFYQGLASTELTEPYLAVDRQLTDDTSVNLDIRYQSALDQFGQNRIESDGWQVNTRFVVRF